MKVQPFCLATIVFLIIACCDHPDDEVILEEPVLNKLSYLFSDSTEPVALQYSACENIDNNKLELLWGQSGFHYISGHEFLNGEGKIRVNAHIVGDEPLASLATEMILHYLEQKPENCFFEVKFEKDEVAYKNIWYETGPPLKKTKEDLNSQASFTINNDVQRYDCLDNWPVIPVSYTYRGWLYNEAFSDSLQLADLHCEFTLWEL